jgi:hypothetical protein
MIVPCVWVVRDSWLRSWREWAINSWSAVGIRSVVCVGFCCFCTSVDMEKENNSDILQRFNIELCSYLTRISRTCTLIRKHKDNLQTYGDFSFPVQLKYWLRYIQNAVTCKDSSTNVPSIPNVAAANPMTVLEYSYLNRVQGHRSDTVFDGAEWVWQKQWLYSATRCKKPLIRRII